MSVKNVSDLKLILQRLYRATSALKKTAFLLESQEQIDLISNRIESASIMNDFIQDLISFNKNEKNFVVSETTIDFIKMTEEFCSAVEEEIMPFLP